MTRQTLTWNRGRLAAHDSKWNVLATGERSARQNRFCDLHVALLPLTEPEQQPVLQQLRELTDTPGQARPNYRCMTEAELRTIAADPLITLGAHTVTHCDLACRKPAEQRAEISGSQRQLEAFIGQTGVHFSYPYGSFNEATLDICRDFRSGVTCVAAPIARRAPRHRLPRFLVRDWDGPEFERHLTSWFRG